MEEINNTQETKEVPIRELIEQYTKYWYLFVLGVLIALTVAFFYLRYSTSLYQSQATIIIKDEKNGGNPLDMLGFSQFGSFLSKFSNGKIDNEVVIFNSKRIMTKTVKELGLNIKYETVGAVKTTEIYSNLPFVVQYQTFNESGASMKVPQLFIKVLSTSEYHIETEDQTIEGTYKFGEKVSLPFGDISVLPNVQDISILENYIDRTVLISYALVENVALSYQGSVTIENSVKNSNVLTLSMISPVPEKAEDFLDELINQYNKDATNDKNEIANSTSQFIDDRLKIISRELDSVENNKEVFKTQNRLTDIQTEAQITLQSVSEFTKEQLDVSTQLQLSKTMIDYMENSSMNELLPSNIGIQNADVSATVSNYNQLILYRNKLLQTSTSKNPVVQNVNNQIEQMRSGILSSLKNSTNSLEIAMKDLNIQGSSLNSKIAKVPGQEKIYRGIERQQTIKEQLYLFLLQQREQASITLAATSPKAKIVDYAYSSKTPVSPQRQMIYMGAFLAGLLLPFMGIYGANLLNTKVTVRRDIEQYLPKTPIIGEIPKIKRKEADLIQDNDHSIMAEAYRILRTNLQYLFINKLDEDDKGKTLMVTSTIKGEGKTFVAFNLALSLAQTGKKVVLVGADIRNPQLQRYLPEHSRSLKGFTEYIFHNDMKVSDVIAQSDYNKNLSIIVSGAIPPNPAELLMQKRTSVFVEELKQEFDYVIMDTAPSMLVTDSILINKLADITLYVVRAGYTDKRLLGFPQDAINDGRLANVAVIMNNVSNGNFGYGNKYGYAYTSEEKSYWQRFLNK